jgi:transposase
VNALPKVTKLDQKERFIELRAKEVPYEQIAKELEVSKPTLIKWGRELELEIGNRRALELELLQDKYFVSKKKRVEYFGEQLSRLNDELAKRDLSEIPTEKLFDITMKTIVSLKQEETEIRLKEKGTLDDTLEELTTSYYEWRG